MNIAYEIATYLAAAGFGTIGTDIHVDQIPADENGIYVANIGGSMNEYLPIEEAAIDIYVKHVDGSACVDTLARIKNHIHRMHNTITSGSYIYSILAIGNIEGIERDLAYDKLYKITFSVRFRDNVLIS